VEEGREDEVREGERREEERRVSVELRNEEKQKAYERKKDVHEDHPVVVFRTEKGTRRERGVKGRKERRKGQLSRANDDDDEGKTIARARAKHRSRVESRYMETKRTSMCRM